MFNSVALDVAIGLVFIFLLYSLLATSVKEGIATVLALRARTLRSGIIKGMLSNTPDYGRWTSILVGIRNYLKQCLYILTGNLEKKEKKLGNLFYNHPLIKNYGSSRIFPHPSYIPSANFPTVLIDVLKQDFNDKIAVLVQFQKQPGTPLNDEQIRQSLLNGTDAEKIKVLLDYYGSYFLKNADPPMGIIDEDTWHILQMHLKNCQYNIAAFSKKLEDWFNDYMGRVSGWYKRQTQIILFIIGMCMAIIFNIDTIAITGKLSNNNTLREQLVQTAVAYNNKDSMTADNKKDKKLDEVDSLLHHDINDVSNLLALGWGDYGRHDTNFIKKLEDKVWIGPFYCVHTNDSLKMTAINKRADSILSARYEFPANDSVLPGSPVKGLVRDSLRYALFYKTQVKNYPVHVKTAYIYYAITGGKRKLLGFLITALAISLGAPFWFDLLNKFVNLRAAGKKEPDKDKGKKT